MITGISKQSQISLTKTLFVHLFVQNISLCGSEKYLQHPFNHTHI